MNNSSSYKVTVFYAILRGILCRLVRLNTFNNSYRLKIVDKMHLIYAKILKKAELVKAAF